MAASSSGSAAAQAALQAELSYLTIATDDYRLTRAIWIASLACLLYDNVLTLGDEVTFLSRGRMSATKGLYLLNRYWPLASLIFNNIVLAMPGLSEHFCFFWVNWFAYSGIPVHFSIGTILILRLYVMYGCNKRLLAFLCTFLCLELLAETIIIGTSAAKMQITPLPALPNFTGCIPHNTQGYSWAYWVPMLCFELTLFALALLKSAQVYRTRRQAGHAPSILVILIRDSVFYFGGVITVIVTNLVVWAAARPSQFSAFLATAFTAHSILGCRMMLNIQQAVRVPCREEFRTTTLALSNFVSGPPPTFDTLDTEGLGEHAYSMKTLDGRMYVDTDA